MSSAAAIALLALFSLQGFAPLLPQPSTPQYMVAGARYLVFFDDEARSLGDASSLVGMLEALGVRVLEVFDTLGVALVEAGSPESLDRLRLLPGVRIAEDVPLRLIEPLTDPRRGNDTIQPQTSISVPTIGADKLHAEGITGEGVIVAVLDTGIDNGHPLLAGRVVWEYDATQSGVNDYCGKGTEYPSIHGTHVAGIIASVAPGAKIYDIIVFSEFSYCYWAFTSDIIRGIEKAIEGPDGVAGTEDDADIINLSLGSLVMPWMAYYIIRGLLWDLLLEVLSNASSTRVVVVAAGNEGPGYYSINYMCMAEGVICVGASYDLDTDYRFDDFTAWFSSRGPLVDWSTRPHMLAPGVDILSSVPRELGLEYMELSGTSMAAPHVSGSAALILDARPDWGPSEVLSALMITSDVLNDIWWPLEAPSPIDQGAGLIDVYRAAKAKLLAFFESTGEPIGTAILAPGYRQELSLVLESQVGALTELEVRPLYLVDMISGRRAGSQVFSIEPATVTLEPYGRANVRVGFNNTLLEPGVYSGYVEVVDRLTGESYRVVVSVVKPFTVPEALGEETRMKVYVRGTYILIYLEYNTSILPGVAHRSNNS